MRSVATCRPFETVRSPQGKKGAFCQSLAREWLGSGRSKMHASNLLKGVLKHRTVNSTSPYQQSGNASPDNTTTRGKRASSPDNTLPCTNSTSRKSSSLAKMACLCAPTKHVGSFRCRLHRVTQKHWSGRPLSLTSTSNASTSSILPSESSGALGSLPRSKILPAPPPGSNSRTAVCRPSRLRMVVVAAQSEDVLTSVDECSSPLLTEASVKYIKVASSSEVTTTGGMEAGASALRIMKNST